MNGQRIRTCPSKLRTAFGATSPFSRMTIPFLTAARLTRLSAKETDCPASACETLTRFR